MNCECMIPQQSYELVFVQGDYCSATFTITDDQGNALQELDKVIFSCARLKQEIELTQQNKTTFLLAISSDVSSTFNACTTTYDVTVAFNGSATPRTVIYNGTITILQKDNPLSG